MSDQVDNRTIIAALVVAIVVSLGGTGFILMKMSELTRTQGFTGLAADDLGEAKITISSTTEIDVSPTNNTINFGTCTLSTTPGLVESITSNMTQAYINTTFELDCVDSNLPAKFTIRNIGNTAANITIQTNSTASEFLNHQDAMLHYIGVNGSAEGGCVGDEQAAWTELATTGGATKYNICDNITFGTPFPTVDVFLNLTIPNNAYTTGEAVVGLTFWASLPGT